MSKPIIGWIGTGVMGRYMCSHILPLSEKMYVYNRTKSKTEALVQEGAIACDSVKEVASKSDIIFTIVGHPQDVEQVYFGSDGIIANAKKGALLVDMTTTKPSLAIKINQEASKAGLRSLDAPVSGGDVGAKEARLTIMVGGDELSFNTALPFFEKMGKSFTLMGEAGSGQHTKMANQILIAGTMVGLCESLLYAQSANLDVEQLISTIGKGAAGCWSLDNYGPRIVKEDYNPGFMVDHFVKDMGIALEEARSMGLALPGLALVEQLYVSLQGGNNGRNGTQSLILALKRLSSKM